MANCFKNRANTGAIHLDPSIVGVVTLLVTVTAFCIFLLCLKRGTPQLWPYATVVLPKHKFTLVPTEEPSSLPAPLFYHAKPLEWQLTINNLKRSFYTPSVCRDTIYIKPSKQAFTVTRYPEWTDQSQTNHMYSANASIPLEKDKTLITGGIDEPLFSPEYLKFSDVPGGAASKLTWLCKESSKAFKALPIESGPSMTEPRAFHHLYKSKNGNILASGGICESRPNLLECFNQVTPLKTLEEFQPKRNKFMTLGEMQVPRYKHAVCQLQNGNFLIVSGQTKQKLSDSGDNLTSTVEVFSPTSRKSEIVGQLHRAMIEPILVPMKNDEIAIIDNQSLFPDTQIREPYVEVFNGTQEPAQKIPHLQSVPELIHSLWHWRE